jgi:hypothetical protein
MQTSVAQTKVLVNVLTGNVKVISTNGQITYNFSNRSSSDVRLRYSLEMLKMFENLKRNRNPISAATIRMIELRIDNAQRQ